MDEPKTPSTRASTLIVMVGTFMSRILGFVRQAVISAYFGGGAIADVLNAAFLIPNNLRKLLAEGALSTAFVPVLSKIKDDNKRAQALIGSVFSFQLWVLIPFLALCFVFAKPISDLLFHYNGSGDKEVMALTGLGQQDLATMLFPWMMLYLLFVSFSAIFMAIHNVNGEFMVPSIAPLMFSISVIVSLFVLHGQLFVWAQIIGVLLGGGLQLLILLFRFNRYGYNPGIPIRFWSNLDFKDVLRVLVPVLGSASIFTITETLATAFSSSMKVGSTAALSNSVVFWQLPYGLFANSITTVLYPKIASLVAGDKKDEVRKTITEGTNLHIYSLIPSMTFLIIFAVPIIAVALQRNLFTFENTKLTAEVMQAYAIGILPMGLVNFYGRALYALGKTRAPLHGSLIIAAIDVILSVASLFTSIGVVGLAIANTLSSFVGAIWLYRQLRKETGSLGGRSLLLGTLKTILICLPMIGIYFGTLAIFGDHWSQGSTAYNILVFALLSIFSGAMVVGLMQLMGIKIFGFLRRRQGDVSE